MVFVLFVCLFVVVVVVVYCCWSFSFLKAECRVGFGAWRYLWLLLSEDTDLSYTKKSWAMQNCWKALTFMSVLVSLRQRHVLQYTRM